MTRPARGWPALAVCAALTVLPGGAGSVAQDRPPVTFAKDIAPIVFARCAGCHRPDGPAPFSLLTYQDARRRAAVMAAVTASRYMPPWKPEPGHGEFIGDRRLSDREIALFNQWAAGGALEGDRADLPEPPRYRSGWQLGEPDLVISLPEYTLGADGVDVFRNFVVPVPGSGIRYVRGLEFRALSTAVHHANIRLDHTPASRRLDDADPYPGYEGPVLRSADYPDGHFLGWTPGQFAPLAPKGLAWRLAPGADFVVQLHLRPTGRPERIRPLIGLFFTDDPPERLPAMLRLGRQNIDIPAGQTDYVSPDTYTLRVDAQVLAVQPHSHYRARSARAWATLPDGTSKWVIDIGTWDFGWQDIYRVADPYWLPAGTRISTEFVFDNSSANPRNPESPPKRARWGFKSSDEMGDVWIQVMTRTDADRDELVRDFARKAAAEDIVGYEGQIVAAPADAGLRDDVALLYLELDRPEAAVPHFQAVVALRPGSAIARYNLGIALQLAGRSGEATAQFVDAVRLDPQVRAGALEPGQHVAGARPDCGCGREYRESLRLQPDNADAHNNLGRTLLLQGAYRDAIEHVEQALRLRPTHPGAHFNLAEALAATGDAPAAAVSHFREALRLRSDWSPALIGLSWLLSSHPDAAIRSPEEAVRLAERASDLTHRTDAAPLDALAAAQARLGRFDEAVATAALAVDLASRAGSSAQAMEIQQRLAVYREHRPYTSSAR